MDRHGGKCCSRTGDLSEGQARQRIGGQSLVGQVGFTLEHVHFEGKATVRIPVAPHATEAVVAAPMPGTSKPDEPMDAFVAWVLARVGLDATSYRRQPLHRRLPACLRALKIHSTDEAHALLEHRPGLLATAVSSLLIGVTEFFREPAVFDAVSASVLPRLAQLNRPLRIWSAACSGGAELYSMAILLAEAGLLSRSELVGTDCRPDSIEQARRGCFPSVSLRLVGQDLRRKYFESVGDLWRPIEPIRARARWKVADVLTGVEEGPWDILLWRNASIYFTPAAGDVVLRRLAATLVAGGVLMVGKAERPAKPSPLTLVSRCIYRNTIDNPPAALPGEHESVRVMPMLESPYE